MTALAETPVATQKQEIVVATGNEQTLSVRASDLVAAADRAVADSPENVSKCADLIGLIKKQAKAIDTERKTIVDPLNAVVKHVNSRFKPMTEALDKAEREVKGKVLAYQQEQARIAREEAARRQKEAEEAALAAAQQAEAKGDTIAAEAAVDLAARTTYRPAEVAPVAGAETGTGLNIQKRWTFRVTDLAALAAAYPTCVEVKNAAVMGLFRAGIKDVPGIEFIQEETVVAR